MRRSGGPLTWGRPIISTSPRTAVFEVLVGPAEEIPLHFEPGWNLVGVPLVTLDTARESASDGSRACLLEGDSVVGFAEGAYESRDAGLPLLAESGYWVYAGEAGDALPTRGLRDDGAVQLRAGWNLITPTATCSPSQLGIDSATFWEWNPATLRYRRVSPDGSLVPGTGYWVHVAEACTIQFPEEAER